MLSHSQNGEATHSAMPVPPRPHAQAKLRMALLPASPATLVGAPVYAINHAAVMPAPASHACGRPQTQTRSGRAKASLVAKPISTAGEVQQRGEKSPSDQQGHLRSFSGMARVWDFSASFEPKAVASAMARIWTLETKMACRLFCSIVLSGGKLGAATC